MDMDTNACCCMATDPDTGLSGKNPILQCMGNRGFCRSSCKKGEQAYFYCRTYQICCLQPYVRISLTGVDDKTNWSNEKHWPRIP
ncbi:beta-defensin 119 [Grammomys surdaster]|uniref:beta-defensin 119 n=1 Tax=Grammomys surdaster TaxID=491861 RepID=UPI0010A037FC|nr:beta-defensin 119 [Grammomys surdaster]